MQRRTLAVLSFLFLAAGLLTPFAARGQGAGTLTGRIATASGDPIAHAHVRVENLLTGATAHTESGADGDYLFAQLPAGTYSVTAGASGYASSAVRNAKVSPAQTLRVNFLLQTPAQSGQPRYMHAEEIWMSQPTLTGDWGSVRTRLNHLGITAWGNYVGESATMLSGGLRSGSNYADDYRLAADLDLGKLVHWKGGNFHFNIDDRHGTSTSVQDIGNNKMNVQEIYGAGENRRFSELTFDQHLAHEFVVLKAGWWVMGNDYASTPLLCTLQNLAFCAHPQSLPGDAAWTDWPTAEWGFRSQFNLRKDLYLRTAIYEGNTSYKQAKNGMKFSFNAATGTVFPVEFGYTTALGQNKLVGHYKIGAYYDTSRAKEQAVPSLSHDGRYGEWLLADQQVLSFEPGSPRGLYLAYQQTPADRRTAPMTSWETGAVIAQGPFHVRKDDFISFGFARAGINSGARKYQAAKMAASGTVVSLAAGESVYEMGYGVMVARWWLIHPNFQYVADPGAFSFKQIPDPWVFGVQTKITF